MEVYRFEQIESPQYTAKEMLQMCKDKENNLLKKGAKFIRVNRNTIILKK